MTPPPPRGLNALASAASSRSSSTSATGRLMAEDDDSLDELLGINDDNGTPEVQEVAPPPASAKSKHPVEEAGLEDVSLTEEATQLVQKVRGNAQAHYTKINTIAGHGITGIAVGVLRRFCKENGIKSAPNANGNRTSLRDAFKHVICERIVA